MRGNILGPGVVLMALLVPFLAASNFLEGRQASPSPQPTAVEKKAATAGPAAAIPAPSGQEATAGPRNPKEQMGVYVFMAWLWAAIIVLVFILGAKVREADRLFEARYLSDDKHPHTG